MRKGLIPKVLVICHLIWKLVIKTLDVFKTKFKTKI